MKGAVLAVGTELLLGDVINSNAAWLGAQLAAAGVEVVASAAVGDDLHRLVAAIGQHLIEADVLLLSGGLGPTVDDLTRDAVALACRAPLERQAALEAGLRAKFAAYGMTMPAEVLRQADVPRGAEVLDNPVGTAPGLWLPLGDKVVVALPGPPHELRAVAAPLWPRLAARSGTVVTTRQVLLSGVGESTVAERVEAAVTLPDGVSLSYLAGGGVVRVRFTTSGPPQVLEPLLAAVDAVLGDHVWGHDQDTLDGVVHDLLGTAGQTVAVAESLTGGLLGAALSQRSGSSVTFRGSLVVYATDLKEELAGVPAALLEAQGAVSAETAAALAAGARDRLGADWGLGVTGVAGPNVQEGKPVGTVHVAVAGPAGGQVRSLQLPGDRDRVRSLTVTSALDLLRRHLQA
ncbi:MAG: competence/damage-inducible protein CinA [Frankiales bacterium]|nr:competence/damage-inducible protein CinA [Frankiales bacterium]